MINTGKQDTVVRHWHRDSVYNCHPIHWCLLRGKSWSTVLVAGYGWPLREVSQHRSGEYSLSHCADGKVPFCCGLYISTRSQKAAHSAQMRVPLLECRLGNAKEHTHARTHASTHARTHARTHTHTHTFNGPLSRTTRVSPYQKGKTNLDFTEARDSEWHWHQVGHMQVCISLQTDNHTSTLPLRFLQARCPSCHPTNSVKALKAM